MEWKGKIPIFIGVTGHLDLIPDDIPQLESKIRAIINHVKVTCPHSPIKILSPLAEGADRLVAKIALEENCPLIVVLPMTKSEYEKDFETDDSKKEFSWQLERAEDVFELPLLEGNTDENIKEYNEHRNRQYASVGSFIVQHSQILMALWNGKDTGETGGTAEIVRFKLEGVPESHSKVRSLLDVPDNGQVYHIFAQRKKKNPQITAANYKLEVNCLIKKGKNWDILYPAGWKPEGSEDKEERIKQAGDYYKKLLLKIDNFNKDIDNFCLTDKVETSKGYIFPQDKQNALSSGLKAILNCVACADTMAIQFQSKVQKRLKILLSIAVIAFFFLGVFDDLISEIYVLVLFPCLLGAGFLIFKDSVRKGYEDKYYDYRVLAEGLRVQFFWKLMEAKENTAEQYLRKYKGEMDWILHAMRNISIKANREIIKTQASDKKEKIELIYAHWIEDQQKYFNKNTNRRMSISEKQSKYTLRFFMIALGLILSLFAVKIFITIQQGTIENILNMEDVKEFGFYPIFMILADTFIAIGAAYAVYCEKRAFNDEVKNFQKMKELFERAKKRMRKCIDEDMIYEAERLAVEVGKEALIENGDWLILQRSRPLEMPIG